MGTAAGQLYYPETLVEVEDYYTRFIAGNLQLRLSTDSVPFADSDTYPPGYPEPADVGYAPVDLAISSITFSGGVTGNATMTISGAAFGFLGADTPAETIYQWWIADPQNGVLMWHGSVSPPYAIPNAGGTLVLSPLTITLGTCTPGAPAPPGPAVVWLDDFLDGPGTALTAHAPQIGSGYTAGVGTFVIGDCRVVNTSLGTTDSINFNPGVSDSSVSLTLTSTFPTVGHQAYADLFFRVAGPLDWWGVVPVVNAATILLIRSIAGVQTVQQSVVWSTSSALSAAIEVAMSAASITLAVDGAAAATISDTTHMGATSMALFQGGSSPTVSAAWRNLVVRT
jgi:hypothetical protein